MGDLTKTNAYSGAPLTPDEVVSSRVYIGGIRNGGLIIPSYANVKGESRMRLGILEGVPVDTQADKGTHPWRREGSSYKAPGSTTRVIERAREEIGNILTFGGGGGGGSSTGGSGSSGSGSSSKDTTVIDVSEPADIVTTDEPERGLVQRGMDFVAENPVKTLLAGAAGGFGLRVLKKMVWG